jgi:hypothetical protein
MHWAEARAAAEALGGYLVTLGSEAENDFAYDLIDTRAYWNVYEDWCPGPFIGLWEPGDENEPAGGWEWVTMEPFTYNSWSPGEPGNYMQDENRAAFGSDCPLGFQPVSLWHDVGEFDEHPSFLVEWDEDPNATPTPSPSPSPSPTPTQPPGQQVAWGDHNCSDAVDSIDALITLRFEPASPPRRMSARRWGSRCR